jgi:hypothetical protein
MNCRYESRAARLVIPAQAGIQTFQSLALDPRFRGGDDLAGRPHFLTPASAGINADQRFLGSGSSLRCGRQ